MPAITSSAGPFPEQLVSNIRLQILSIAKFQGQLKVEVWVSNHSKLDLPARSSTGNPFRLSWRLVDLDGNAMPPDFITRQDLDFDVPAGAQSIETLMVTPPTQKGRFSVEVSGVREESVGWLYDHNSPIAKSNRVIAVSGGTSFTIQTGDPVTP